MAATLINASLLECAGKGFFLFRCGLALRCGRIPMGFNAVTDFSATNNPNGVWQYLVGGALLPTPKSIWGLDYWHNNRPLPYSAAVWHNPTSATIIVGNGLRFPVDHLNLDPEMLASVSVRFTAPTSVSVQQLRESFESVTDFARNRLKRLDCV
jgi:hypothetical protein